MSKDVDFFISRSEDDAPLLSIKTAKAIDFNGQQAVAESEKLPVLLLTASVVRLAISSGQALAARGTYRLIVDPGTVGKLAQVKGSGNVVRGFFREGGKITGHAKLKPVNGAKLANLATLAFEVATIITSTVHLKDIGVELKGINDKLDRLHGLMNDQRLGQMESNAVYFKEILALVEKGLATNFDLNMYNEQLELIYRDSLKEIISSRRQIERRLDEMISMKNIEGSTFFYRSRAKDGYKDTQNAVKNLSESLEIALVANRVATMACSLGVQFGRSPAQTIGRIDYLINEINCLIETHKSYEDFLKRKFSKVLGEENFDLLRKDLIQSLFVQRKTASNLLETLNLLRDSATNAKSLEFVVKVSDGEVVDARPVLNGTDAVLTEEPIKATKRKSPQRVSSGKTVGKQRKASERA